MFSRLVSRRVRHRAVARTTWREQRITKIPKEWNNNHYDSYTPCLFRICVIALSLSSLSVWVVLQGAETTIGPK